MNNFVYGFFYPFKCIKLFFKYPKLILYSIVPMIINLIIYGTIFFYTYRLITGKSAEYFDSGESKNILIQFIQSFLKIFVFLLVLVVCYFLFIIFGGIVSAPFNEKISKFIEERIFNEKTNELPFFKDAGLSIIAELKKILFYFSIMIPLLLIEFIPMIGGVITLVFGTGFSFFYNGLDYMDYPLTRRLAEFKTKLKVVNSQKMLSYGFGGMAFLMTLLPIINVIMKPVLVAAGTSLFYERDYNKFVAIKN